MANNRRDLHIGITGDAAGLDKAVKDSEDSLRGLDRELAKIERQQAANEKVTTRTAAAVKKFGAEQDKAALAARRLGNEAEKAAKQAEQAQIRADAAADAYTRGLISEETALRAAARAEDAIERAAIKAAEAHRGAARAAEDQAQQERQLAREATLGAAAEELAVLKASGRVREHNNLLRSLEGQFGDLSKEGSGAFTKIETFGSRAATSVAGLMENVSVLGTSGPVAIGLIVAAIEALPTVATIAGGAVALGLGGALSLAAIKAQASSVDVQTAFAQMKAGILGDLQEISQPFHATLLEIPADAEYAFKQLEPSLSEAFALMAPAITRFVRYFAGSLGELDPAIRSIGTAFTNVLDDLGPEMPTIIQNIGTGIEAITNAVAENPQALTDFVTELSMLTREVGDGIGILIRYSNQIHAIFDAISGITNPGGGGLIKAFERITGGADSGGKALAQYKNTLGTLQATSDSTGKAIAKDMETLATSTASAATRASALSDAFARLLDPQAAVYADTLQLRSSINQLGQALAASGGRLDDTTKASAAAGTAFGGMLKNTQQLATDMLKNGDSIEIVRQRLWPYIGALAEAAGSNRQAQDLVSGFSQSLGLVAPALDTNGHAIGQFGSALNDLRAPSTAAQLLAEQLGEDYDTLSSKTATAEDKTNALSDAFTRLLDPALAAYQDTAKLRQGMDDLAAALKKSHGALDDHNKSARDAKDAFAGLLKDAEQYAEDLLRGGDSVDVVRQKLAPYIATLEKLAGKNRDARILIDQFARSLNLVPSKKNTTLTSNVDQQREKVKAYQQQINALHGKGVTISDNANSARARIDALQRSITNLKNKTVTVTYLEQVHHTLQAERGSARAMGGIVRRAMGGPVQHLADGGPSGMVYGPGTATSDSIMAALSNGEFVVNARATAANRPLLDAINSGVRVPVTAAAAPGGAGGSRGVDVGTLARAVEIALDGVTVQMDSQPVGQIMSRRLGRSTDQRRRTG